jgi:hypothetical protein
MLDVEAARRPRQCGDLALGRGARERLRQPGDADGGDEGATGDGARSERARDPS